MTTEIQVIPENQIALAFQNFTAQDLFDQLKEQATSIVFDLNNPKDQKALRSQAYKVRQSKTAFDNHGKLLKEQYTEITKKIDQERNTFKKQCDELVNEMLAPLVAIELAEQNRVKMLERRIEDIKAFPELTAIDSKCIARWLDEVKLAKYESIEKLEALFTEKQNQEFNEAEQKRLDKIDEDRLAELDRIEKDRIQKERDDRIAKEAAEKARLDAEEKARIKEDESKKREAKLQQDNIDALNRQKELEKQALEREEQAKIDRDNAVKAATLKAEQDHLARIEADKKKAEKEAQDKAAADLKRQENKKHQLKICNETLESLLLFGLDQVTAKSLINAMHEKKIANVTLNY